jgi:metallo-beta-lactamase family protein
VTPIFRSYAEDLNADAQAMMSSEGDLFTFEGLTITKNKNESNAIHKEPAPKVIIAGAGMSAGGRIRAHEAQYLGDKNATVLFVGYQAPGTLGRRLQDGANKVHIDGEYIRVHASIASLSGYSGHADRDQLMQFVENTGDSLEKVFVTMGETKASLFLAQRITDFLGVSAYVPKKAETQTIDL